MVVYGNLTINITAKHCTQNQWISYTKSVWNVRYSTATMMGIISPQGTPLYTNKYQLIVVACTVTVAAALTLQRSEVHKTFSLYIYIVYTHASSVLRSSKEIVFCFRQVDFVMCQMLLKRWPTKIFSKRSHHLPWQQYLQHWILTIHLISEIVYAVLWPLHHLVSRYCSNITLCYNLMFV